MEILTDLYHSIRFMGRCTQRQLTRSKECDCGPRRVPQFLQTSQLKNLLGSRQSKVLSTHYHSHHPVHNIRSSRLHIQSFATTLKTNAPHILALDTFCNTNPSMPLPKTLLNLLSHHFSTAATTTKRLPKVPNVPTKYKSEALNQAQKVLTDYLHTTRSLPYTYAQHISNHSLFSLSNLVKNIPYSAPNFSRSFQRFLRYHPINEFEFFFESIGIHHTQLSHFLPTNKFFLSEDQTVLEAACALSGFGFPWNMLGKLYREEHCIFRESCNELKGRLSGFKECGWSNLSVVGMCLAFPMLLRVDGEFSGEVVGLLDDLKRVFVEFDIANSVEGNVDTWYGVCRMVRVFYDSGVKKGKVGELLGRKKHVFLQHSEEVLVEKANYFCRLGVRKEDVGLLILQRPEVLSLELEKPVISTMGLLRHLGLDENELKEVSRKYPYAMGRNRMVNVPHLMRALDLHVWFFTRIKDEHQLLGSYVLSDSDEDGVKKEFSSGFEQLQSCRTPVHAMKKLDFMHSIGFGENPLTLKVLTRIHGRSCELEKRFDILLNAGLEFSQLCLIISTTPKILNQNPEYLEAKINFLCGEMKSSLKYFNVFPAFLCFDLENRIKPRYRFYAWLQEKGLHPEGYSFATMIATSEKRFVAQAFTIHPAAPKHWFECFLI